MEIIIHRINKIESLKNIPKKYGTEIDIRSFNSQLILNHEPHQNGDTLINYLNVYNHGTLVLNIKESGIENEVLNIVKKYNIQSYFLLDVEAPFLFRAMKENIKDIAVRYSEYEPLNFVTQFNYIFDWVWIDTLTKLPINKEIDNKLSNFQKCLVCPERWGRKNEISKYKNYLIKNKINLDAVMTSLDCSKYWV